MEIAQIKKIAETIRMNVAKVIVGKEDVTDLALTALLAGGHMLLEDVPGTGKTMLAKSLAKSVGIEFRRVQFTPDLLPSDLTGISYFNQKQGDFTFRRGPVFTGILLADEINRATPRTQSSLLECMEEKQVTVDGVTYPLEEPYFVIATQNPVETQGTFPLPEAQLDRFLIKSHVGYPSGGEEEAILEKFGASNPYESLPCVCSRTEIAEAAQCCRSVYISRDIAHYIVAITEKTRSFDSVLLGVSPRGSIALMRACKAYAAVNGQEYVTPDTVKYLAPYVLGHRLILKDDFRITGGDPCAAIKKITDALPVPTEHWEGRQTT